MPGEVAVAGIAVGGLGGGERGVQGVRRGAEQVEPSHAGLETGDDDQPTGLLGQCIRLLVVGRDRELGEVREEGAVQAREVPELHDEAGDWLEPRERCRRVSADPRANRVGVGQGGDGRRDGQRPRVGAERRASRVIAEVGAGDHGGHGGLRERERPRALARELVALEGGAAGVGDQAALQPGDGGGQLKPGGGRAVAGAARGTQCQVDAGLGRVGQAAAARQDRHRPDRHRVGVLGLGQRRAENGARLVRQAADEQRRGVAHVREDPFAVVAGRRDARLLGAELLGVEPAADLPDDRELDPRPPRAATTASGRSARTPG